MDQVKFLYFTNDLCSSLLKITLEKFCNENEIDLETIIKKEKIRYEGASTLDEFEIFFFKKNNFSITNKIFNDKDLTEINVYYKNKNILDK